MEETILKHHGIYGQKWGIRRFQNPDGSLTPAGRKRYGVGEKGTIDDISTAKGIQKRLNDVAKANARNSRYARDFYDKYANVRKPKYKNVASHYSKNVERGQQEIDKLITKAEKLGLTVDSRKTIYDTMSNSEIAALLATTAGMNFVASLAGIPAPAIIGGSVVGMTAVRSTYDLEGDRYKITENSTEKQEKPTRKTEAIESIKSVEKEAADFFKDHNSKPPAEIDRDRAVAEIAESMGFKDPDENYRMADTVDSIWLGVYEDGGQGKINEYSLYANRNNKVDEAGKLDEKYNQAERDLGDWREEGKIKGYNRYALWYANQKFTDTDKQNIKRAESIVKNLRDNSDSSWYFLNKAVADLNLGDKDAEELTKSDWDKINARIRRLALGSSLV